MTGTLRRSSTQVLAVLFVIAALSCSTMNAPTVWQVGPLQIAPGKSQSGFLPVPAGPDGETRIPVTVFNGIRPGPTVAFIAGNHGYEYPPILASQRLIGRIDPQKLNGRVILVHVANMPSFLKRTIYYSPVDGQNLNRVYPGKVDGTLSQRIAYVLTKEVIERCDYLVDLHCGDGNESLRPYSYWMPIGVPKLDDAAKALTIAFGLPNIVVDKSRPNNAQASLYCSNTAMTRGKPATTIESGAMGVAEDETAISAIERGCLNVMRYLKIMEGKAELPQSHTWYEPTEVLTFPKDLPEKAGLFFAQAKRGDRVEKDALLGTVTDFFGKTVFELKAPFAGEVLYIIGTPPISAGEPLAFLAAIKQGGPN
jgi:predicted deacylase